MSSARQINPGPSKLDVTFINPFIEGTIATLKVQCHTDIFPQKPLAKAKDDKSFQTDIAGILGINCPTFTGSIALCFPEKIFLSLMSKMLGEEFKELNADLEDGAAELLNMIFGHAKSVLNKNGHAFEKTLPTVVRAQNLSLNHTSALSTIILPFAMQDGLIRMEIGTDKIS